MISDIVIEENRELVLKNISIKSITFEKEEEQCIENYVNEGNLQKEAALRLDCSPFIKIIIELKKNIDDLLGTRDFNEELKTGPCLFARYEGEEQYSYMTQCEMRIYAHKNGIILDKKSYNVFKKGTNGNRVIDVFIPIVGRK